MEVSPNDDVDINLESAVLASLSKLQTGRKGSKKQKNAAGVSCKRVVDFLKANYPWVDGDVESQVITALLSCMKTGLVCALNSGKFLPLRATARNMISECVTRVSHGPKCCCLPMLQSTLKTNPKTCCYIKGPSGRRGRKCPPNSAKSDPKPKSPSSPRRKRKPGRPGRKRGGNCAQNAQKRIGTSKSDLSVVNNISGKCNYCLEIHSLPKFRKLCMTCYPIGRFNGVPPDNFSPRDEVPFFEENAAVNTAPENMEENAGK